MQRAAASRATATKSVASQRGSVAARRRRGGMSAGAWPAQPPAMGRPCLSGRGGVQGDCAAPRVKGGGRARYEEGALSHRPPPTSHRRSACRACADRFSERENLADEIVGQSGALMSTSLSPCRLVASSPRSLIITASSPPRRLVAAPSHFPGRPCGLWALIAKSPKQQECKTSSSKVASSMPQVQSHSADIYYQAVLCVLSQCSAVRSAVECMCHAMGNRSRHPFAHGPNTSQDQPRLILKWFISHFPWNFQT